MESLFQKLLNLCFSKDSVEEDESLAFYFYENDDQSGVISPLDESTIMNIPYQTGWYGQRYLLSTYNQSTKTYTPLRLQNIKEISFTIDLSGSQFTSNDNINFNCYLVSSASSSSPNCQYPPINNTKYVNNANYYDAAGADGGRYGVEFDIFETNSGNNKNEINFYQHTGHFDKELLTGVNSNNDSCMTFSSSSNFNSEPDAPANGAPDTNYRTKFSEDNKVVNVKVNLSNPNSLDETTISMNDVITWNSKWLVGGTWSEWPTAPQEQPGYPCSSIGTLVPFADVTTESSTPNGNLTLETINKANKEGYWLFIGMNPYFTPNTGSYNSNHDGTSGPNGSGGNIKIKNFTFTSW